MCAMHPQALPSAAAPSCLLCLDSSSMGISPLVSCCQQVLMQSRKAALAAVQELLFGCWCPLYLRPPELCGMHRDAPSPGGAPSPVLPLIPPPSQHSDVPWG